jgi:hypothetical protein
MSETKKSTAKKPTAKVAPTATAKVARTVMPKASAPAKKPATNRVVAPRATGPQLVPAHVPTHDEIQCRAYEIWAGHGYTHGNHAHDWTQAEQELKRA